VARLLTRLVAQPILQLTHAVARVSANKDYSLRCEKHGGDELGVLTDGFNEMLAQIEQQDRRLKEYSAELERRVSERTRDLEQTIAALQTAKMAAETASRAKTEFLSSMSHELRTPLNAIIGFAQLLEFDQKLDEEQVDSVREIYKAGQHLLALINEVLDLARIESGRMEMNMEPVALGGLVDECVTLVQSAAAKETVSLHRDLSPCTGHLVWADRLRLKQVLLNLLSNAIKYNRRGGHVDITCHRDAPGRIRLAVSDTGLGIPMDQQAKLFTPFNRLGQEGEAIEGTGIGLVICKRVLEMMGGSIGFTSQPGHGTTFWFELGEADAASQAAEGQGK
jgi:signal transduction histidine kinase